MKRTLVLLLSVVLLVFLTGAYIPTLTIGDSPDKDAFSRLRVSATATLLDSTNKYFDDPQLWESITYGGSSAHQANSVAVRLSTGGTTAGNYTIRQSKIYPHYQSGKSQLSLATFTMGTAQTNAVTRIGQFDHENGFFLERDGSTVNLVARSWTGTDLVTNGTFTTNTTGWTASGSSLGRTTAFGDGELTITNSGAAIGYAYQAITTVAATRYQLTVISRRGTAAKVSIGAGTTTTGMELATASSTNTGDANARQGDTLSLTFVASGTTTYITLLNDDATGAVTGLFDWVGCKASDTVVAQSAWNLDKFDGTGLSGTTIDLTKAQILVIDFQYLGVGRCRIGFDIAGRIFYAHQFVHANVNTGVFNASGGSLPIRGSVHNKIAAAGGTITLDMHCAAVMSEGGSDTPLSTQFMTDNGLAGSGAISAQATIISLRPGQTFNSIKYRGQLVPLGVELMCSTNAVLWRLHLNPTTSALTFAAYDATRSAAEISTTVGTISANGVVLAGGLLPQSGSGKASAASDGFVAIPLVASGLKNVQDTLVLAATPLTGNATINATMTWREVN